jgi:hypothetical protein
VSWQVSNSKAVAQTLHVAAIAGLIGPGYAKRDAKLRRAAGVEPAAVETPAEELHTVLAQAATTESSAWNAVDAEWFTRRWQLGEEGAVASQSHELISALEPLNISALLPAGARVQASTAVGGSPLAVPTPSLVIASSDCAPQAIAVCAIGAQLSSIVPLGSLRPEDHRWMIEMIACTAIRETVGELVFTDWVKPLMKYMVGEFKRSSIIEGRVRRIASACLDQPPGEIERIGVGLGRRLQSRLDRAFRRGFFTPPNVDLAAWLDTRLPNKESSRAD